MGSVMLHGHEKGGKLDARAVMCVCVGVDMESKGWRMLDPSLMRIRIARNVDFLENGTWKDWDKAKGFGELLQDAAEISQLLPLPLSPPSAVGDDVDMPLSSPPPAPLSVSLQQQPAPLQQLSGPSVIRRRSATQASSSSSSSGQRPVNLSTSAPTSPATTSPPPVTGLQVLGIQSGTGGEEAGGDAGVVDGMMCLAKEVEGVALAGASTSDVPRTLAEALRSPQGPAWKAGAEIESTSFPSIFPSHLLRPPSFFLSNPYLHASVAANSGGGGRDDIGIDEAGIVAVQLSPAHGIHLPSPRGFVLVPRHLQQQVLTRVLCCEHAISQVSRHSEGEGGVALDAQRAARLDEPRAVKAGIESCEVAGGEAQLGADGPACVALEGRTTGVRAEVAEVNGAWLDYESGAKQNGVENSRGMV
ncbi:unnamed protein product [Closterium sp. Naga37s-1]|nr:unnamed protein product [Closterium sp. Naga37s-1]